MKQDKTYTYNWMLFIPMVLCIVVEAYWVGLGFERKYDTSITLAVITYFGLSASGFLLAFINSRKEKGK